MCSERRKRRLRLSSVLCNSPRYPTLYKVREPREADPADYNEGDVTSYSETDNLDDQFIEEALFLSPEDRDARDVEVGSFEDWAEQEVEEEGEIVEVVIRPKIIIIMLIIIIGGQS